jgi:hypothetical protein
VWGGSTIVVSNIVHRIYLLGYFEDAIAPYPVENLIVDSFHIYICIYIYIYIYESELIEHVLIHVFAGINVKYNRKIYFSCFINSLPIQIFFLTILSGRINTIKGS